MRSYVVITGGLFAFATATALGLSSCSSDSPKPGFTGDGGVANDGTSPSDVVETPDVILGSDSDIVPVLRDPETCEEAKTQKSYLGCEYWPTVVGNIVWSIFDFAVAVANPGKAEVTVTVTRTAAASGDAGAVNFSVTEKIPPGALKKIYLPWVADLKGPDLPRVSQPGQLPAMTNSVMSRGGAYKLVSTTPVIVYQFNALEAKGQGGPANKDWSQCPGTLAGDAGVGCYSFTNDASLLLPTAALTGNYRVTGQTGWTEPSRLPPPLGNSNPLTPPYFAITATANNTSVTVNLPAKGKVVASREGSITTSDGGAPMTLLLNEGDVAEIVGQIGDAFDFSGALVTADKPIQIIAGNQCTQHPSSAQACDHIEESVLPVETLGKHYLVNVPTAPKGDVIGHIVRFYGNFDGTTLTYKPVKPPSCPATLNAGDVVDCGRVNSDIEVTADKEFAVGSFMLGGQLLDPTSALPKLPEGDPSQSNVIAVEQYRRSYIFLAPDDYSSNWVDVTGEQGTVLTLDNAPVTAMFNAINASTFGTTRIKLTNGSGGVHTLTATKPVGVQVVGYYENTSFQYPGGLNLGQIAPKPPK